MTKFDSDITAAYRQAMDRGLYDRAVNVYGKKIKPYARANDKEYFAELSCAYLNKLDYFPFNRDDLKRHDPAGYKLMELTWGSPKQIATAVRIESEKAAARKLAAAKKMQTEKKTEEAAAALVKLVEYYPNSKVTAEAKALLEKLQK
jgi:hypothetical protein